MKRLVLCLLFLSGLQFSCSFLSPVSPTPAPAPTGDPLSLPWEERAIFAPGLIQAD